jgi:protein-arginine kinase activator protein McsA
VRGGVRLEHFQEKHAPGLIGVAGGFPSKNAPMQKARAVSVCKQCETTLALQLNDDRSSPCFQTRPTQVDKPQARIHPG